ncbi:Hypothetical protein GLP15_1891 [Giardia lamblia P15]|uniref:Uncharacterized protein n=1 Tax=Giardia intestinalis (strain P15) TaxID=658858 RepID=E1F5Z2_GIAIA|nr:Hypothetical protein GLP15_1891 [Giardia lamblia P15]
MDSQGKNEKFLLLPPDSLDILAHIIRFQILAPDFGLWFLDSGSRQTHGREGPACPGWRWLAWGIAQTAGGNPTSVKRRVNGGRPVILRARPPCTAAACTGLAPEGAPCCAGPLTAAHGCRAASAEICSESHRARIGRVFPALHSARYRARGVARCCPTMLPCQNHYLPAWQEQRYHTEDAAMASDPARLPIGWIAYRVRARRKPRCLCEASLDACRPGAALAQLDQSSASDEAHRLHGQSYPFPFARILHARCCR